MKKLIIAFVIACLSPVALAANVIIVNPQNSNEITKKDVKRIFLGKKGTFADGKKALPITFAEGDDTRAVFLKSVLRKTESQYVSYWSKLVFTGAGVPPQEVKSMQEMKELVATNPSTIGYIDESLVDGTVKVVDKF